MFKKVSYNVKKAEDKSKTSSSVKPKTSNTSNTSNTQTSTMTLKKEKKKASEMTLKQKANITNANNKESPEYRKKSHPKTVTTNKRWVENKTFKTK